jgi:GNAT superfamily N-acetyltransferase
MVHNQDFKGLPAEFEDRLGRRIRIRAYEKGDYRAFKGMYDSFEPKAIECGLPPTDRQTRTKWIRHMASIFLNVLAFYRGRVVGHSALDLACPTGCPEFLLFIREGFRDCGIGSFMLAVMKEIAEESGSERIILTVRAANAQAIRAFRKIGFVSCGGDEAQKDMELCFTKSRPRRQKSPGGSGRR